MLNYDFNEKYQSLILKNSEYIEEQIRSSLDENSNLDSSIGSLLGAISNINADLISAVLEDYHKTLISYIESNYERKT